MLRQLAAAAALSVCLAVGAAPAVKCKFTIGEGDYIGDVTKAITEAKNCRAGAELATACAMGSSGDVQIADAAYTKCEKEVKLTPPQKTALEKSEAACTKKYAHKQGTMYQSINSFCHLDALTKYAK
jgi:hypothetical protein